MDENAACDIRQEPSPGPDVPVPLRKPSSGMPGEKAPPSPEPQEAGFCEQDAGVAGGGAGGTSFGVPDVQGAEGVHDGRRIVKGYAIYSPLIEGCLRQTRKYGGFDKKDTYKPEFMGKVMHEFLVGCGLVSTINGPVFYDEARHAELGRPCYFAESEELLDGLWKAKMAIEPEDLYGGTPECFSVSWPAKWSVKGFVPPRGCLVWFGKGEERRKSLSHFSKKWLRGLRVDTDPSVAPEGFQLHLSHRYGPHLFRVSVPDRNLRKALVSLGGFNEVTPLYNNMALSLDTSEEERKAQYEMVRLVVGIMAYIKARPENVRKGFPAAGLAGEIASPLARRPDGMVLSYPRRAQAGVERGAAPFQIRSWHFRRWPLRRDGTRERGTIFIDTYAAGGKMSAMTVKGEK